GTDEEFKGKWGGAGIRLDRDLLGKMKDEKTLRSYSGPVYINLTVDLTDNAAPSTKGFKKTPRAVAGEQFLIGIKEDAKSGEIRELKGLGCLSVDLGLRQVAACSVFRMKPTPPKGKFCFPIAGFDDLFMAHERSFLLSLPGEQADSAIESQRGKLRDELNKLSAGLAQLNKLIRLSGQEGAGRLEELKALLEAEESLFDLSTLKSAKAKTELAPAAWRIEVERIHRSWERKFAQTLENWRKAGARSQQGKSSQYGVWGISLNGIDYLERTRKLLIRWTTHPRKAEETNRLAKNKLFAARLQKHIDALKEDRIKKAADAIVMAALGYVYAEDGKRTQKYKPCSIILLEDLDRYRFRTDRPRFENSKLMQWAHRAIFHEIARQAGLFGIVVGKVGAGFTSRFHAGTGTPGCRCAVVTQDMLRKPWFLKRLEEDGLKPAEVKAGQIIQMEGGKLFCSIESDKPVLIQADINAAQNLQKRFWTNYAEPFRAVCTIGQAPGSFIPLLQKRTEKFFSGKMLAAVNTDEPFICELVPSKGAVRKKPAAEQNSVTLDDGRILLHDEDEAAATKKTIFFRDPSGALLPKTRWYESKIFWSQVKQRVRKGLTIASDRKRCYT
ncbi:MAG: type V CRISPR-associated protein Cas12b, partial [Elusimicrobia bacterium]|nr:type V CRISPR-associated protein Cas12b [Elusimicrobiota bacterium]